MANNDDVQQADGDETLEGDASSSEDASQVPASLSPEEIAQLRRDAAQARASQARADRLAKDLERYTAAERKAELDAAGEDGRLQVELKQAKERAEAAERKAVLAERKASFPLAATVLGEELALLSEERIAALQASLEDGSAELPTPLRHNENKSTSPTVTANESSEDIKARLLAGPQPNWFTSEE